VAMTFKFGHWTDSCRYGYRVVTLINWCFCPML